MTDGFEHDPEGPPEEHWARVLRYISGDPKTEDVRRVARWIGRDLRRRELLESARANASAARAARPPRVDTPAAWRRLRTRIERGSAPAAPLPTAAVQSGPLPIRKGWRRHPAVLLRAAAIVLVAAGLGQVWRQRDRVLGIDRPVPLQEIETRVGQQARVRLADGTRIILGPAGRLRYPADFGHGEREVALEGEAFFEVAPDRDRPFTVRAGGSLTRVLGTEFNLRAFPGDHDVQVVVAGGRVAFGEANGGVHTILTAGFTATLEADGTLTPPRPADLGRAFAWTEGRLVFQNAPLADVARALERRYAVRITFADTALAAMPATAEFRTESAAEAIRLLALSLGLKVTRAGPGYLLHLDVRQ